LRPDKGERGFDKIIPVSVIPYLNRQQHTKKDDEEERTIATEKERNGVPLKQGRAANLLPSAE
jgi:hypothetical protein